MDLQEKLNEIETKIKSFEEDLEVTKLTLKELKKAKKWYLELIEEKAKALEQK